MKAPDFEWDESKNLDNIAKHGVSFQDAQQAFQDEQRVILEDSRHSDNEQRYFCLGKVCGGARPPRRGPCSGKIRHSVHYFCFKEQFLKPVGLLNLFAEKNLDIVDCILCAKAWKNAAILFTFDEGLKKIWER